MKIENSDGYEIEYDEEYEGEDLPYLHMYNDWGTCMSFKIDSKGQIDKLKEILNDIEENYFDS